MNPESNQPTALPWTVHVDDNFHYMDKSYRTVQGHYATLDEAATACFHITQGSVEENGNEYTSFGEDPWIMPRPSPQELKALLERHPEWPPEVFADGFFSAWTYAGLLNRQPNP